MRHATGRSHDRYCGGSRSRRTVGLQREGARSSGVGRSEPCRYPRGQSRSGQADTVLEAIPRRYANRCRGAPPLRNGKACSCVGE